MRNTQLVCFFDTGCLAKNWISWTPGVRFASNLVPQDGFDRTYRNQSRSVDGWSNVTKASSCPGGNSAITSLGHSKRGLLYPETKYVSSSFSFRSGWKNIRGWIIGVEEYSSRFPKEILKTIVIDDGIRNIENLNDIRRVLLTDTFPVFRAIPRAVGSTTQFVFPVKLIPMGTL